MVVIVARARHLHAGTRLPAMPAPVAQIESIKQTVRIVWTDPASSIVARCNRSVHCALLPSGGAADHCSLGEQNVECLKLMIFPVVKSATCPDAC